MKTKYIYPLLTILLLFLFHNISSGQSAKDFLLSANAKFDSEDYNGALLDFNKAVELNPYETAAFFNRGLTKKILGDFEGAIWDYDKALELDSIKFAKEDKENNYDNFSEDLLPLLNELKSLRMYLLAYKYCYRGVAKSCLNNYKGAMEDYNTAIYKDSTYLTSFYERGSLKLRLKDFYGAFADFDFVIKKDSAYSFAYNGRGYASSELNDNESALKDYDKSVELDPLNETSYVERAGVKINLLDLEGAVSDYDKAIELNPNSYLAYFGRSVTKSLLSDNQGACEDLQMAKILCPEDNYDVQKELEECCN